jgi:hypothetical protein
LLFADALRIGFLAGYGLGFKEGYARGYHDGYNAAWITEASKIIGNIRGIVDDVKSIVSDAAKVALAVAPFIALL